MNINYIIANVATIKSKIYQANENMFGTETKLNVWFRFTFTVITVKTELNVWFEFAFTVNTA